MIWSSMEYVIKYVHKTLSNDELDVPVATHAPKNTPDVFALVDRTGGEMDYPHDYPEYSVSIWARSEAKCEELAHVLAIGLKTKAPDDDHINAHKVPVVFSYGQEEGGFFVWQVTFNLVVNIQDE